MDKKILFIHNPVGPTLEAAVRQEYGEIAEFVSSDEAVARAGHFDALMTLDRKPLPGLLSGDRLDWVHAQSHGFFQLLDPELKAHRATVTNARGCHPESVSEHVFAMLLALTRRLPEYLDCQAQHKWQRHVMDTLYSKTMCVVGVGNIGSAVARRAKGFGMRVIGVDVERVVCEAVDELVGPKDLDSVLPLADVIALCVPYNETTQWMFCKRRLNLMKPGSYLINIARGGIVDETELITLLETGRLRGAGFDVFDTEPLPQDSALWDLKNLILLPHSASQTELSRTRLVDQVIEQIRRYLAGEPLLNVVKQGIKP